MGPLFDREDEPEFPSIFELFVGSLRGWTYRGTYRRMDGGGKDDKLNLPNLTAREYMGLPTMAKTRLLKQALRQTSSSDISSSSLPCTNLDHADPFASGHTSVSCIGLQCVGFNADLYHALVAMRVKNTNSTRSSESPAMDIASSAHAEERSCWSDDAADVDDTLRRTVWGSSSTNGHKRARSDGGGSRWSVNRITRIWDGCDEERSAKSVKVWGR
ncbi:hypothetical protein FRB93_000166 [Tulasnella sp. JGI-2019a]|nr:hypothetical protein FRB93_000166 [Tulasnella sp. JGI-2019a]